MFVQNYLKIQKNKRAEIVKKQKSLYLEYTPVI